MKNEQNKVERIRVYISAKNSKHEYETVCIPTNKNLPIFLENVHRQYSHLRAGRKWDDVIPVWAEKVCIYTKIDDAEEYQEEYRTLCSLEEAREVFHSRNVNVNDWPSGTFDFLLDSENQPRYELMREEHISKNAPETEYKLELLSADSRVKAKAISTTKRVINAEKNAKIKREKQRKLDEDKKRLAEEERKGAERENTIGNASPEALSIYPKDYLDNLYDQELISASTYRKAVKLSA